MGNSPVATLSGMSRPPSSDREALAVADVVDVWSATGTPARNWTLRAVLQWIAQQPNREDIWLFRPSGHARAVWLSPARVDELILLLSADAEVGARSEKEQASEH